MRTGRPGFDGVRTMPFEHHVFYWPGFVGMILFWAVVVFVLIMLYRAWSHHASHHLVSDNVNSAEQILHERFAKGEIDDDEYQKRLTILRSSRISPPPTSS